MSSRSEKYLARLDAALAQAHTDRDIERILTRAREHWEHLYAAFLCEDREPHPNGPQAADYMLTICGISKRLADLHSPGGA
jgi:hypothetical protein